MNSAYMAYCEDRHDAKGRGVLEKPRFLFGRSRGLTVGTGESDHGRVLVKAGLKLSAEAVSKSALKGKSWFLSPKEL